MASIKKNIKLDGKQVYDTELVYTRVICLQQYRDIDIPYMNCPLCQHLYLMRLVQCVLSQRQS